MEVTLGSGYKESRTNLIINHLPHTLTEPEFHKLFSTCGTIRNYRIMKDLQTGASFGFGFVEYTASEDASKAILQLNNHQIQNKRLKVSFAQQADESDDKETNLYIQNLPKTYTPEDLETLFGQFGKIIQKLVFRDKATGMPKGVAFVKYENKSEAYAAIEALNNQVPQGATDALLVKIAKDNTTKRKTAFQAGYQAGLMRGSGRGRGTFNGRGLGFARGGYTEMAYNTGRGYIATPGEYAVPPPDFNQVGKMGLDRVNNRYNPIGSGGGYTAGTGINITYGTSTAPTPGVRTDPTASAYSRLTAEYCSPYGAIRGAAPAYPSARY